MDQSYSFLSKNLIELDQETHRLIEFETRRQERKIILIASESVCPQAVLEAQASPFSNIYAEGYPSLRMTRLEQDKLGNISRLLSFHRRYGDRRHYKGCDYVDFVEALAQYRAAQVFAPKDASLKLKPEDLFVNVQALSGAAANNAVYQALANPGDVVLGLALPHGGHLTHGSEFNRSGKLYKVIHYEISAETGHIDYEQIRQQARRYHPKIIIAGASAYPWSIEWQLLREICDEVGAYLFADIAHPAGLVAAGLFPNPVGYAHVTTMTTHKTLCGPRGAIIITTDEKLARKIDNAVFPGEQGGPHINTIAGLAVTFKLVATEEYRNLMKRVVENAQALVASLQKRGLTIAYGGTTNHLCLVDLNKITTPTGLPLKGDVASNILDLCGITCNKNTIPGDITSSDSSAVRFGTTWVSQLGMGIAEMDKLAELIHKALTNIHTFTVETASGVHCRGRISCQIMEEVRKGVAELMDSTKHPQYPVYPHYYYRASERRNLNCCETPKDIGWETQWQAYQNKAVLVHATETGILEIAGERAENFLNQVATVNVRQIKAGCGLRSFILNEQGKVLGDVHIFRMPSYEDGYPRFWVITTFNAREAIKTWLRDLSDGYVYFDNRCIYTKIDGPVIVADLWESVPTKTTLKLLGVKAKEIVGKLHTDAANLAKFQILEVQIQDARVAIAATSYAEEQSIYEIYLDPIHVSSIVSKIQEIEKEVLQGTCKVVSTLREQAGLANLEDAKSLVAKFPQYWDSSKPYFVGQYEVREALPKKTKRVHEFKVYDGPARQTCLFEEHRKLSDRDLVPFAGWLMPILYTSILEEHKAARNTAALFDVTHMGVLEISGPGSTRFLDLVATNFVSKVMPGQSQYSYLIDPDGKVIDDIMVYCRAPGEFMVIVNACNAEKDFAWLKAVLSKEVIIDKDNPNAEIDVTPILRDLKDSSAGKDCLVDIALQGPKSLAIMQCLANQDKDLQHELASLAKASFIERTLAGIPMLISRSGYTGEDWGFEIYLHPGEAPRFWNLVLEKGKSFGVLPTGLGARDSTRTEAGFPLYGHELCGTWDATPHEANYGSFVKYHKPFFIGKTPLLQKDLATKSTIIRFEMTETGIRAVRPGALVVNRKGQMIGGVTSCTFIDEEHQIGMAYIDQRYAKVGTKLGIFMPPPTKKPHKIISDLKVGDTFPISESAVVISRFPMRK